MTVDPSAEILRLRATVRDLLALSTIPEAWVGREPPTIAADLADLLIGSLGLDFAFVRLCDPMGRQVVEVTGGNSWKAFPEWLQEHLAVFGQISRKEIVTNVSGGEESCCGVVIPIGVNSERGLVAAASDRPDFPDQIDQQLLSVAANNAATAFQNACLINKLRSVQEALTINEQELRKARDKLEVKVIERTSELRRSEFYLAAGQRLAHMGSWVFEPAGFFDYWSHELFHIYGLDPAQKAPSLEEYLARVHPQDREFMRSLIEQMIAEASGCDVTKRIVRPDSEVRYVRCVGTPVVEDGALKRIVGTAMDVTEHELLTQELRRRQAYLSEAQRLSHTGSWYWNVGTGEVVWSQEFFAIFGFDSETTKPSYPLYLERIHPEDRSKVEEVRCAAAREKRDFEVEYRLLLPSSLTKYLHSRGRLLSQSGDVEFIGAVMDITERKRAEEEREGLRRALADLAHINRVSTMGELTASLAHEIKQPISAAITNAKTCLRWLARDQPDVAEAQEAASRVVKDVSRASDIISRIGSLFKRETLQRQLVDINELIREMIVLLRSEAARYSISIQGELANDLPQIMADRVQLQQVFMNLMLNGIEAMKDMGTPGKLTITSQQDNRQVLVSVADTGVGLQPEQAEQIFNAFFTSKPQGTGMGLPISRSIIESHGGRLWATPNSGPGTTFQFTLPVEVAGHQAA